MECLFADLKRRGFNLEDTRLTYCSRQARNAARRPHSRTRLGLSMRHRPHGQKSHQTKGTRQTRKVMIPPRPRHPQEIAL
ncbi:hypothetical protein [Jiella flava]|uniref:hypothetical protein n=1 Tax=Jiella flava TaxID=2816857 RepID=UPI0034E27443